LTKPDVDELLAREADAWIAYWHERTADRTSGGWSASTGAAHIAFWMDRATTVLQAMATGTHESSAFAVDVDEVNARMLPEWSAASMAEAWSALEAARKRLLYAWASLPVIDDAAVGLFVGDTFGHYEEHMSVRE